MKDLGMAFLALIMAAPSYAGTRMVDPDEVRVLPGSGFAVEVLVEVDGQMRTVPGLPLPSAAPSSCAAPDAREEIQLEIANEGFSVKGPTGDAWVLRAKVACRGTSQVIFRAGQSATDGLWAWTLANKIRERLAAETGLDFWTRPLRLIGDTSNVKYDSGDLYFGGGGSYTDDGFAHEFGHAVYFMAGIGGNGGAASHHLEDCSEPLFALAEGWPSFFAAWALNGVDATDAPLGKLVSRRSPYYGKVSFENVPAEVCKGPASEWRVGAFFWDLVDRHDDGEQVAESFARVFAALRGQNLQSAADAAKALERAGFDRKQIDTVWKLNFRTGR